MTGRVPNGARPAHARVTSDHKPPVRPLCPFSRLTSTNAALVFGRRFTIPLKGREGAKEVPVETQTIVIIATVVVVAVVLAGGIAYFARSSILPARRTARLKQRFGPEYERAVATHGDTATAERDLTERLEHRNTLELRNLTDSERRAHIDTWTVIQQEFVDAPVRAVHDARGLVEAIMRDVGYPDVPGGTTDDHGFERLTRVLSVDHPSAVSAFHRAHAAGHLTGADQERTESLREALVAYRGLADSLLGGLPQSDDASRTEGAPPPRGPSDHGAPERSTSAGSRWKSVLPGKTR